MKKRIALVAHDNRKADMIEWVSYNRKTLLNHNLVCTGTTGKLVEEALIKDEIIESGELNIRKLKSGPLGGDQQLGSLISDGKIDIFLGGAKDQAAIIYLQTNSGYDQKSNPAFSADAYFEDTEAKFFDVDNDGDLDLFVGSGGNHRLQKSGVF